MSNPIERLGLHETLERIGATVGRSTEFRARVVLPNGAGVWYDDPGVGSTRDHRLDLLALCAETTSAAIVLRARGFGPCQPQHDGTLQWTGTLYHAVLERPETMFDPSFDLVIAMTMLGVTIRRVVEVRTDEDPDYLDAILGEAL